MPAISTKSDLHNLLPMVHHLYSLLPTLIVILGGERERKEGEEGKQREEKEEKKENEEEKKKKEEAKDKINLKGRNISHISPR